MKVILIGSEQAAENNSKYAVCLGMFDGIHIGHRRLIEKTVELAEKNNIKSAVLTFIKPFEKNKIYPFEENLKLIEELGVDTVFAVNFTPEFMNTSPEHFIDKYLIEYIMAEFVVCGFNFRFGKDRAGDSETLRKYADGRYALTVIPEVKDGNKTVSSTYIKELLEKGQIEKANSLLGACFHITGPVVKGNRLGRTIDFPTVNIPFDKSLKPIKTGVYSSKVLIENKLYEGISNVGAAPTVRKESKAILETHIIDYKGYLYNKNLTVFLIGYIREEKKFNGLYELKSVISDNIKTAKKQIKENTLI